MVLIHKIIIMMKIHLGKKQRFKLFSPGLQHGSELLFEKEALVASINDMFSGFGLKTNHFLK